MRARHFPISHWQRATNQLRRAQADIQLADAANIQNTVQRTHFMEMHIARLNVMRAGLARGKKLKAESCALFGLSGNFGAVNYCLDVSKGTMFMFMGQFHQRLPAANAVDVVTPQIQAIRKLRHDV